LFAVAADFTNGGFETGDFTGWTRGAGTWTSTSYAWPINPTLFLPGGADYDLSYWRGAVVTPGPDPIVGAALNRVYNGNYAARINDQVDNYDYSLGVIKQTVANYADSHIYFAWAAVLEASHDYYNSDNFTLKVTDDTTNETIYSVAYSSATTPASFHYLAGNGWYYSDWKSEDIDLTGRPAGHTYSILLLASDCALGGHAGYVYLDGFAPVIIPPGPAVPEPSAVLLTGTIFGLVAVTLRKRMRRT
jgi:hypothetical protein